MNKTIIAIAAISLLSACQTPATTLTDPTTGTTVKCGGDIGASIAFGAIGYHLRKEADKKCVAGARAKGYTSR